MGGQSTSAFARDISLRASREVEACHRRIVRMLVVLQPAFRGIHDFGKCREEAAKFLELEAVPAPSERG